MYVVVITSGCLPGWLFFALEKSKYGLTLERAKFNAAEFERDIIRIIENRARLNRTLFKNNNEIQNEKSGLEKCYISSFMGLAQLIPTDDLSFQDKDIATEILYPDREFVRISPAIKMTVENFEDCTSCHQHEDLKVGDSIGAIGIRIPNVKG